MYEYIFSALVRDEAITLLVIEPFHCAFHECPPDKNYCFVSTNSVKITPFVHIVKRFVNKL